MKELENQPETTGEIVMTGETLPVIIPEDAKSHMTSHNPSDELAKVENVISNIGGEVKGEHVPHPQGKTINSAQFDLKTPPRNPSDEPSTWRNWLNFKHKEQERKEIKDAA